MAVAQQLCHTSAMSKKKIGRPNEERRARELLERIVRKKAASNNAGKDLAKPVVPNSQSPKHH